LTDLAVFPRLCDGASGAPDVTDPAVSNRLKTSTFAPAPTEREPLHRACWRQLVWTDAGRPLRAQAASC